MTNPQILPIVEPVNWASFTEKRSRLLITSDGFEQRSLNFLSSGVECAFNKIILCVYDNREPTKYGELLEIIKNLYSNAMITEVRHNRFEPFLFEVEMQKHLFACQKFFEEIILDISVMSKYMIMQIMALLKDYSGDIRIIYTEPVQYAPRDENEWKKTIDVQRKAVLLPSVGVQNIVKTPLLTSLIMQQSPSLLVSFLSFNEQLIRALLFECNPYRVLFINGAPPHLYWREKAMYDIHKDIIKEYIADNNADQNGLLARKTSTLDYTETFELLATIYNDFGEDHRIILSPTGSKMQAIGASLIKNCCEDIHVEYPTPESYYVGGYSSQEIRGIHQVMITGFRGFIKKISEMYKLNG